MIVNKDTHAAPSPEALAPEAVGASKAAEDLATQVDELLGNLEAAQASLVSDVGVTASPETRAATPNEADASGALAREIDELLTTTPAAPQPAPVNAELTSQIDTLLAGPDAAQASAVPSSSVSASPEPAAAPSVSPAVTPHAPAPVSTPIAVTAQSPPEAAKDHREGAALRVLAAVSRPLQNRPAIVRQTVGWVALNTLFIGAVFWAWMIFFRPAPATPTRGAFNFADDALPQPPQATPAPEADAKEPHAKPKQPDAQAGSKKASAKKESHGGGH